MNKKLFRCADSKESCLQFCPHAVDHPYTMDCPMEECIFSGKQNIGECQISMIVESEKEKK